MLGIEMWCLGDGPTEADKCRFCGDHENCLNRNAKFGLGTLAAQMERYGMVVDKLTACLSEKEKDVLQEMIDCAGYTASNSLDYVVLGRVPDDKQIEAEKRMEKKQRKYLAVLVEKYPKIWRIYCQILTAIEPDVITN